MSGLLDNMSAPGTSNQNVAETSASNMPTTLNDTPVSEDVSQKNKNTSADTKTTTQPKRKPWTLNDLRSKGLKRPVHISPFDTEDTPKASNSKQTSRKRSAEDAELHQSSSEPQAKKAAKKTPKTKSKNALEREREYYNNLTAAGLLDHELDAGSHVSSVIAPAEMGARLSKYSKELAEADKAEVQPMNKTPSTIVNKQRPRGKASKQEASIFIQKKPAPKKVLADKTNTQRQPTSQHGEGSVKAAAKQPVPAQKASSSANASSSKKRSRVEDEDKSVDTTANVAKKQRVDPTPGPTASGPKVSAAPIPATANMSKAATETQEAAAQDPLEKPKDKHTRDATEDDDVSEVIPTQKASTHSTTHNEEKASANKPQKKRARDAIEEEQELEALLDSTDHIEEKAPAQKPQKKRARDATEEETEVEALPQKKTKVNAVDLTEGEEASNNAPAGSETEETRIDEAGAKVADIKEAETKDAEAEEAEVENAKAEEANIEQPKIDAAEDEENATDNSTETTTTNNTSTPIAPKSDAPAQPQRKKGVARPTKPKPAARKAPAASKENDARKEVRKYVRD